jgi:hypothetical protein
MRPRVCRPASPLSIGSAGAPAVLVAGVVAINQGRAQYPRRSVPLSPSSATGAWEVAGIHLSLIAASPCTTEPRRNPRGGARTGSREGPVRLGAKYRRPD